MAGCGCCLLMDLMRSKLMQLVHLIILIESSHLTVSYLGDVELLQFMDRNKDLKKCFGDDTLLDGSRVGERDVVSYPA